MRASRLCIASIALMAVALAALTARALAGGIGHAESNPPIVVETPTYSSIAKWATVTGAGEYIGIGDNLRVFSPDGGFELSGAGPWGDAVHPDGDPLHEGVWFFPAGTLIINPEDGAHVILERDAVLYRLSDYGPTPRTDSCRVTCQDGYYACCSDNAGEPMCKCVSNSVDPGNECESGGPGARECALNEPTPHEFDDLGEGPEARPIQHATH